MKEPIIIELTDHVNCRLLNLDPKIKRELREKLKYFMQWARHLPVFKAGYWDGYEYLIDMGGRTYVALLDVIVPMLVESGYEIEIDDRRSTKVFKFPQVDSNMFSHIMWPKKHKFEGQPIVLMDHQVKALQGYFNEPTGIQVLPTSAGKTLLTAAMAYHCENFGRTIIIVPNKSLVTQTEEDFINLGLDVGVYYGDRKELGKTHTICTWQSLSILSKNSKKDKEDKEKLLELLSDVESVIVDEVHNSKAKELKTLLSGPLAHCGIRWGLTGTMPKDEYDNLVIMCVIGEVIGEVKPSELQEIGHLATLDINIIQMQDDKEFGDYHTESKYLTTNQERLEWIDNFVADKTRDGNTLLLVDKIATGEELLRLAKKRGANAVFISGKDKNAKRKEEYDEVHDSDDKLIIATYGVAAVGINIPRIFNLVLIEAGKSFVRVIQSIGRGLRTAKDKNHVTVFDMCSSCKYSKKHLTERKKFYKEKEYPFTISKVIWK